MWPGLPTARITSSLHQHTPICLATGFATNITTYLTGITSSVTCCTLQECARALGVIASEVCPLRDKALQQPYLGKMLTQLRKSLQVRRNK